MFQNKKYGYSMNMTTNFHVVLRLRLHGSKDKFTSTLPILKWVLSFTFAKYPLGMNLGDSMTQFKYDG